ncbi:MAG: response regulator [Candidatus Aminicenantaceae bacterium]
MLIADDSKVLRTRLVEMLSEIQGLTVVGQAEEAAEAVAAVEKLNPDVVIMDIRMPGGGGIKALEAIKQNKLKPLIIILTNYPFPQYRRTCMERGADYFFSKSTEMEYLMETLQKMADKRKTQKNDA